MAMHRQFERPIILPVLFIVAALTGSLGAQCPNEVIFCPGAGVVLSCPLVSCNGGDCIKVVSSSREYCACDVGDGTPPQPTTCHIYLQDNGDGEYEIKCSEGICPGTQTCPTGVSWYVDPQGCKHFTCPCS